ncbi:MAG: phenylpyruvate tautomerase MIF-related protein [Eubacteriales bacterium]
MPYIQTLVNIPLPVEKERRLKALFGQAIAIFPGKTERWLMLHFAPEQTLYFAGTDEAPTAYLEVSLLGQTTREACEAFTARVCAILKDELQIPPDRVYIKYHEAVHWGYNGTNF